MQATANPTLNPQVIGQAESALGALLAPVLAETGRTFEQWLVLTVLTANGGAQDRTQLIARIAEARKIPDAAVETAVAQLTTAGALAAETGRLRLTAVGQAMHQAVRARIERGHGRNLRLHPRRARHRRPGPARRHRPRQRIPGRPPRRGMTAPAETSGLRSIMRVSVNLTVALNLG